jgi:pyruvate dehydrogenase E2 component (dihydrolipoamide acetyltransferase)
MATVVRMPGVVAGADQAVLARWLVRVGDEVRAGTPVAEIETDKALVEYPAEEAGIVGRLMLAEGQAGQAGDPILVLLAPGEPQSAVGAALGGPPPPAGAAAAPAGPEPPAAAPAARGRVFASPLVRKMAAGQGIDLTAVEGTGPGGRVVRRDLERLAAPPAGPPAPAPSEANAAAGSGEPAGGVAGDAPGALDGAGHRAGAGRLIPHTPMRRAIARRLTESQATVPHFSMVTECLADELLALRERVNAAPGARVSVNDLVVMAAAGAYGDVPEANVTWTDEGLLAHENIDISIAVATDGGLLTPVLRDLAGKRLTRAAREARDLAARARARELRQHEIEGGVMTVSNLGMHGTPQFTAIISPPQSAILAVGAARPQPAVLDGALAVATVMRCTLSVDHRAIDGALAARWLAAFTARVESPLAAIA